LGVAASTGFSAKPSHRGSTICALVHNNRI
jgi:hypothetical protein